MSLGRLRHRLPAGCSLCGKNRRRGNRRWACRWRRRGQRCRENLREAQIECHDRRCQMVPRLLQRSVFGTAHDVQLKIGLLVRPPNRVAEILAPLEMLIFVRMVPLDAVRTRGPKVSYQVVSHGGCLIVDRRNHASVRVPTDTNSCIQV